MERPVGADSGHIGQVKVHQSNQGQHEQEGQVLRADADRFDDCNARPSVLLVGRHANELLILLVGFRAARLGQFPPTCQPFCVIFEATAAPILEIVPHSGGDCAIYGRRRVSISQHRALLFQLAIGA